MEIKHTPIKKFNWISDFVLRILGVSLTLITLAVSIAYIHFNHLAEIYSEDLIAQTLYSGAAPQYEAVRDTAGFFGGLMIIALLLCYALLFVTFHISRKRFAEENARVLEENFRVEASEARYRLIALDSTSILFEINYNKKTIEANEYFEKFTGEPPSYASFLSGARIHPDDKSAMMEMSANVKKKPYSASGELRIRDANGNYVWFSVIAKALFDKTGNVICIICKLTDIDAQKREIALLELQAQTDSMTGLTNKAVTEALITQTLQGEPAGIHAMLIFDIDDLKKINDTLGHCEGDNAIRGISSMFRRHFRSTDIVGRIGGDEFMVFLRNIGGEEQLRAIVTSLRQRIEPLNVGNDVNLPVRVSIGAVLTTPRMNESFQQLYRKADAALYQIKRNGKNGFCLYTPDMKPIL